MRGDHESESGWLSNAISAVIRRRLAASDSARLRHLRSGADLDEQGLPFGTIPAAFIDTRDDARLVFPNAREIFRKVNRGAGSALATVVSFDDPPAARVRAGYLASAASTAILAWYRTELRMRGWEQRPVAGGARSRSEATEVFSRGAREWISVTVPGRERAQRILRDAGLSHALSGGEAVYVLDYSIGVQRRPRRGA